MVSTAMRPAWILLLASTPLLAGCAAVQEILPPDRLQCGGTEPATCRAVAEFAISRMNLVATGPITQVVLTPGSCDTLSMSYFRAEMRGAAACWIVEVTGERSYGGGAVYQHADGTFGASW